MGISASSSAGLATPAPVYSGIDKLTAIFEDAQDESGSSSISHLAVWKDALPILTDGLLGLPVPDRCCVVAMHILKETITAPYHEMLIFEVISEAKNKYYLRVDRFVANPNMTMLAASESKAHLTENNCRSEHQAQVARRLESIVGQTFDKATSAFFDPEKDSFRRLLDLLAFLSKEDYGDYNLWDRSCYWFSSMIYRTFCKVYIPIQEIKGGAYHNLGKFARRGYGIDHLSTFLDDNGKLLEAWEANKSTWTPISRFLCKEKGRGVVRYDPAQNKFVVSTRVGFEFDIFTGEGLQGDDRPGHIAKGPYSADLNGRIINITSHGSSPADLRFRTRDEALIVFNGMRNLMNGFPFAIQPIKILVDRRHTDMLIAQSPEGPKYLPFSSHTLPKHPNIKLFKPLSLRTSLLDNKMPPLVESTEPLSVCWKEKENTLIWRKEFIIQITDDSPDGSWRKYWEKHVCR